MKRIIMTLISIFGILLVPLLPLVDSASAAGLYVGATPNPGVIDQVITINIVAADEETKYQWAGCVISVSFGDYSTPSRIGYLTSGHGGQLIQSTTHKYLRTGTFSIVVSPIGCKITAAGGFLGRTSVTIKSMPKKSVLPALPVR
jgi:hypothetical protein